MTVSAEEVKQRGRAPRGEAHASRELCKDRILTYSPSPGKGRKLLIFEGSCSQTSGLKHILYAQRTLKETQTSFTAMITKLLQAFVMVAISVMFLLFCF